MELEEGVAVARGAVAQTVALPEEPFLPGELAGPERRPEVLVARPDGGGEEKAWHQAGGAVAPVD